MPEVRSPTVRRRELGALLRKLRLEKGLTVEHAAEHLLFSMSKLSRMETGHGIVTARDIRDLCELYDVTDEAERERMMTLATEGRQQGWWQSYNFPWTAYVGLEAEAVSVIEYKSSLVPGLLQTPEYMRALAEAVIPPLTADEIDQMIEVRLTRQRRLIQQHEPLKLRTVLDEAALHRAVGGATVMAAQLRHLVAAARAPNVGVQILPYAVGAHPAVESTFNLLEFRPPVPDLVYVEGLVGSMYLEQPHDLERYRQIFENLQDLALSEQGSTELIKRIKSSYNGS